MELPQTKLSVAADKITEAVMKRRIVHVPSLLIFLLVAAGAGYGAKAIFGLNFWIAFIVAAIAMLLLGWLSVVEDEMPGGFNNPKGRRK